MDLISAVLKHELFMVHGKQRLTDVGFRRVTLGLCCSSGMPLLTVQAQGTEGMAGAAGSETGDGVLLGTCSQRLCLPDLEKKKNNIFKSTLLNSFCMYDIMVFFFFFSMRTFLYLYIELL